ncbi:MAG: DoxX family protein [Siphonobacter aquaeclarae]|jgi:hypothetical protein|nr:DoxX family protein [Siphonobacter aquaeclarae]
MKRINLYYWLVTGLFALLMAFGSIPDILVMPEAKEVFRHLGYPEYLIAFLGVAKMLGIIAILVPGFPRLKEWAYAGLFFDLTGAIYSAIAVGDPVSGWGIIVVLGYGLLFASYALYHKRRQV